MVLQCFIIRQVLRDVENPHKGYGFKKTYSVVVGHLLEIIIDHGLESVAAVDAIF